MSNRCLLFLLILSISFGYNPSSQKTSSSTQINTPVQKTDCGTESSPFNAQSPQEFHEPINRGTKKIKLQKSFQINLCKILFVELEN